MWCTCVTVASAEKRTQEQEAKCSKEVQFNSQMLFIKVCFIFAILKNVNDNL